MHEFLKAWAGFERSEGPNLLTGDEALLEQRDAEKIFVLHRGWSSYSIDKEFGRSDPRLHLSLIPLPFVGPIASAKIAILLLNPGLHPGDYYAEQFSHSYCSAILDTLHGHYLNTEFPNVFLDPAFSWHPGFQYWHGKLSSLVESFAESKGCSRREALSLFSRSIAFLELVPYHSTFFGLSDQLVNKLRSVSLAKSYVHDNLLPMAKSGQILLVVTRQVRRWRLEPGDNVILYSGGESRAAHLTGTSRGGVGILNKLLDG